MIVICCCSVCDLFFQFLLYFCNHKKEKQKVVLFAIVDIETTGSYAAGAGITEIAIVIHDGYQVLSVYETLINPRRSIPYFIQRLTGISDDMVATAPDFAEVAPTIYELLHDKVFVAHNVNFDFSFVKHNLEACGYTLDATRKLCTVRLARKVIPGYKSYSLGKITHALGIVHEEAHRAAGDAHATAKLFTLLCEKDAEGEVLKMLKGRNREQYLPPNVPVEQLDNLPSTPGVYYFYNQQGKIIYIGKAINLKKRVKSHFSNNKTGRQKADFLRETFRITYEETATDLMAQILESTEIRKLWPVHNRSQKGFHPKFGIYAFEDRLGFMRLAIEKLKPNCNPLHSFNTLAEGLRWLRELCSEFELCARLCHIADAADCSNGMPAESCKGNTCAIYGSPEEYNAKISEAIQWMNNRLPTMIITDVGRHESEHSCILIVKGVFVGMGYLDIHPNFACPELLTEKLKLYPDNDFIRSIIYRHVQDFPYRCRYWNMVDQSWMSNIREAHNV